jgi:hypothetical protein
MSSDCETIISLLESNIPDNAKLGATCVAPDFAKYCNYQDPIGDCTNVQLPVSSTTCFFLGGKFNGGKCSVDLTKDTVLTYGIDFGYLNQYPFLGASDKRIQNVAFTVCDQAGALCKDVVSYCQDQNNIEHSVNINPQTNCLSFCNHYDDCNEASGTYCDNYTGNNENIKKLCISGGHGKKINNKVPLITWIKDHYRGLIFTFIFIIVLIITIVIIRHYTVKKYNISDKLRYDLRTM